MAIQYKIDSLDVHIFNYLECSCDITGTINNSIECEKNDGQCKCIETRTGLKCKSCKIGYFNSDLSNIKCESKHPKFSLF